MHHKGYDIIYADPGALDEVRCRACGARCDAKRSVPAASGFAESLAGSTRLRDVFTCPHAATEWHVLALKLVQEIERTPSKRIAELMRLDLRDLLSEHVPDDAPHAPEWLGRSREHATIIPAAADPDGPSPCPTTRAGRPPPPWPG